MMLHHVPAGPPTKGLTGGQGSSGSGPRPPADVVDIRDASLEAKLRASVKLARQEKGERE